MIQSPRVELRVLPLRPPLVRLRVREIRKKGKKKRRRKKRKEKKKRGKKRKKKSSKGNITGRRTAYAFFMKGERHGFSEKHPNVEFGQLSKIMGKYWREEMDQADKKKYYDQADEDKIRFETEKKEQKSKKNSSSSSSSSKPKKKKRKKDPNEPKQPSNAYIFWSRENRKIVADENPKSNGKEINKLCGKKWKSLNDSEKEKYVKMYEQDKERYKKQMEEYNKKKEEKSDLSTDSKVKKAD